MTICHPLKRRRPRCQPHSEGSVLSRGLRYDHRFVAPIFSRCIASLRDVIKAERRLVFITRSKFSTVVAVIGSKPPMPTLFTMMSMSPHSSSKVCIAPSRAYLSQTSRAKNRAPVAAATSSPRVVSISQNATRSPASVNASTMARPMPCPAPVTNTRRINYIFTVNRMLAIRLDLSAITSSKSRWLLLAIS